MHGNVGFFATWFPGDPLDIGDVGVLDKGRFRRMTTLKELNIDCDVEEGTTTQEMQYSSTEGTKIETSLDLALTNGTKGLIKIEFSRGGAYVFNASGLRTQRLSNRLKVAQQIINLYEKKKWEKDWIVVESLYVADRVTIIVSEDTSAGIVIQASINIPVPALTLSDPKIDLKVVSTRGKILHIVGGQGMHPLYSCFKLKDPLFGKPSVQPVRGAASMQDMPVTRVDISELLDS
jgi:hypothetical protein